MILTNRAYWEYGSCQEILVLRLPTLLLPQLQALPALALFQHTSQFLIAHWDITCTFDTRV